MVSLCLALRPDAKKVFRHLDAIALTADYDAESLQQLQSVKAVSACRESTYYLASLCLHAGDMKAADRLLTDFRTASPAMKRYYHVLTYARRRGYPVARLSTKDDKCIELIESVLNPDNATLESVLLQSGGFTVVGNAPGGQFKYAHQGTRFYFNNYKNNERITESASVHVVTPSFKSALVANSKAICITGNDCFYRRSRVWQKFAAIDNCRAIYTVPSETWRDLYKGLGTSPSAGLLILSWLDGVCKRNPGMLDGCVAGFSDGVPETNHSYDTEPPSARHNWEAEASVRQQLIHSLKRHCSRFVFEL